MLRNSTGNDAKAPLQEDGPHFLQVVVFQKESCVNAIAHTSESTTQAVLLSMRTGTLLARHT